MQAEFCVVLIQNVIVLIASAKIIWQCAKKNKKSNSTELMVKSAIRPPTQDPTPAGTAPASTAAPPSAAGTTGEAGKDDKKAVDENKKAEDKPADSAANPADGKDGKKDAEEKKIQQSMKPFPKFVMPTESAKKRKVAENEEDKKKKIKEGFYQENSGEDDTLEKVKSLEVEKSDKTKRSQRKKDKK